MMLGFRNEVNAIKINSPVLMKREIRHTAEQICFIYIIVAICVFLHKCTHTVHVIYTG